MPGSGEHLRPLGIQVIGFRGLGLGFEGLGFRLRRNVQAIGKRVLGLSAKGVADWENGSWLVSEGCCFCVRCGLT